MSKISNIGKAVLSVLKKMNMNQDELASAMNSTQASVSRLISGKNRPSRITMNALCTALKKNDYSSAVQVLIGHLEDEIVASGMLLSDVDLTGVSRKPPINDDIERHLDIIRRGAQTSKDTRFLLRDLAWLIERADLQGAETNARVKSV